MNSEQRAALTHVVSIDPDVMHGTPCFSGTRVPVQTLFDFLETGETIDNFVAVYPYISRQDVNTLLEVSKQVAIEQLCASS